MAKILLGEPSLPLASLVALSRPGSRIALVPAARRRVLQSRAVVDRAVAKGATMYGINTGFGKLAGLRIADDQLAQLQRNLLLSHATGVGEPLAQAPSRLAFALRIHNLALGFSGVRIELLEQAMALFNADLTPVIPSQGSVGASGDLAPLSHMALPLIGFAYGVRRIPLSMVGLLQYIAPTLQLMIGVLVLGEPFDHARATGFACIWAGLAVYALDGIVRSRRVVRVAEPADCTAG